MKMTKKCFGNIFAAVGVLVCAAQFQANAQPHFDWAAQAGGAYNDDYPYNLAVDSTGNVFVVGWFCGVATFGSTNLNVPAYYGYPDAFLAKYDPTGNLLWVRQAGGSGYDNGYGVAVDPSGAVYVCGAFHGTANFGPTNLIGSGNYDLFLAKYDASGTLLWARQAGGSSDDYAYSVAVDALGSSYITGTFIGTAYFNSTNVSSVGNSQDLFLAKYDTDGSLVWVRQGGGSGSDRASSVALDNAGNPYVTGFFSDVAVFNERALIARYAPDVFIAKYDPAGNILWLRQAGGNGAEEGTSIAVDGTGNCFVGGYFSSDCNFSGTNLVGPQGTDMFVAKYNHQGDLAWVRQAGSSGYDAAMALCVDTNGNCFVAGQYYGTLNFGSTNLYSLGYQDIFLAKYSAAGDLLWAMPAGSSQTEVPYAITSHRTGDLYLAGQFYGTVAFGNTNVSSPGNYDIFLAKLAPGLPVISTQPISLTLMEGATAVFDVGVTGTPPLWFQWQFNGVDLPGATNQILSLPNVRTNQSGTYRVVVSNYEGPATSQPAQLLVLTLADAVDNTALTWTSGGNAAWFSQTNSVYDGVDALRSGLITNAQQSWLETTVTGPARVSFWWKVSSENSYDLLRFLIGGEEVTNISGKIDWKQFSVLVPAGTQKLQWVYSKDESESVGQDAGWVDNVTVTYAPVILAQPVSQVAVAGMNVTLQAGISGTPPMAIQWQLNGTNIVGATNASLILSNVQPAQAGNYTLTISNSAGVVTSTAAVLTVQIPPLITTQPVSQTVGPFGEVVFAVESVGQAPLAYQWQFNGSDLPGATNATLALTNVQSAQVGDYSVLVSSPNGSTRSQVAHLTLLSLVTLPTVVVEGTVGRNYRIEYKDQVNDTAWSTLTNIVLPASPYMHVDFTATNRVHRFYRVTPAP